MADDSGALEIITASYHTHGAYSPGYYNEVPSGGDMEGDADEGVDSCVATSAVLMWYIDSVDILASELCGYRCVAADVAFDPADDPDVEMSYSYDDLVIKLAE